MKKILPGVLLTRNELQEDVYLLSNPNSFGELIGLDVWHVYGVSTPLGQARFIFCRVDDRNRGDIWCEPRQVVTRATAVHTPIDHSIAYPAGGVSDNMMAVTSPIQKQLGSPRIALEPSDRLSTRRLGPRDHIQDSGVAVPRMYGVFELCPPKKITLRVIAS